MSSPTRYDDALPRFAALVESALGAGAAERHLFLRDAEGRITFVVRASDVPAGQLVSLRAQAARHVAPYVSSESGSVATPDALYDLSLADPDIGYVEELQHAEFQGRVRVVERRVLGKDWLTPPAREPPVAKGPIVVFASHKGGVGRSTALAVAAADFASRGERVLVVDLDLESPGAGDALLPDADLPEFGSLDFLVENGLSSLDAGFLSDLVGTSPLSAQGIIDVVPVIGRRGRQNPSNVLGKLSRAYLEDPEPSGDVRSLLVQTQDLLRALMQRQAYSVALVDARAGLNEATAAAILGLGADVLLFGMDTPQTFHGYRFLLAHLRRFLPDHRDEDDFRLRLRMVHARASALKEAQAGFRDRAFDLFAEHLYEVARDLHDESAGDGGDLFNFDLDDSTAPHHAWPILDDASYREFDPLRHPEMLREPLYARTFGPFLENLRNRVGGKG